MKFKIESYIVHRSVFDWIIWTLTRIVMICVSLVIIIQALVKDLSFRSIMFAVLCFIVMKMIPASSMSVTKADFRIDEGGIRIIPITGQKELSLSYADLVGACYNTDDHVIIFRTRRHIKGSTSRKMQMIKPDPKDLGSIAEVFSTCAGKDIENLQRAHNEYI